MLADGAGRQKKHLPFSPSRDQNLPTVRIEHTDENLCARGGYELIPASRKAEVTLIATGSEIEIAIAAQKILEKDGIPTRVVSMPCTNLFDEQSPEYRADILGKGTVKVAIEAALRYGWDKYIGPEGGFVGMTGFGASAPAKDLYKHFNITPEAAVQAAKDCLEAR